MRSHLKQCSKFVQGNTNATSKIILAHCAKKERKGRKFTGKFFMAVSCEFFSYVSSFVE